MLELEDMAWSGRRVSLARSLMGEAARDRVGWLAGSRGGREEGGGGGGAAVVAVVVVVLGDPGCC